MARRTMTNRELLDMLTEAQEKLGEVIEAVQTYVKETGDEQADLYIITHLQILAGEGRSVGGVPTLETLKSKVKEN